MVRGSNCELLTPTQGTDRVVTCLAIHSPNPTWVLYGRVHMCLSVWNPCGSYMSVSAYGQARIHPTLGPYGLAIWAPHGYLVVHLNGIQRVFLTIFDLPDSRRSPAELKVASEGVKVVQGGRKVCCVWQW